MCGASFYMYRLAWALRRIGSKVERSRPRFVTAEICKNGTSSSSNSKYFHIHASQIQPHSFLQVIGELSSFATEHTKHENIVLKGNIPINRHKATGLWPAQRVTLACLS